MVSIFICPSGKGMSNIIGGFSGKYLKLHVLALIKVVISSVHIPGSIFVLHFKFFDSLKLK